jgi:hypothetical protein
MERLLTRREYNDTTPLIDSSGYKVGEFRNNELVTNNEIAARQKSYTVNTRTITNSTIRVIDHPYQPVNQVFVGAGIIANQVDLLSAFKAGILLKNKKDAVFEINATVNKGLNLGGEIGFYKLISFKKK